MDAVILVDCETTGPTPFDHRMTEFGAVSFVGRRTFYAQLWPFTPHPDHPALPVVAADAIPLLRVEIDGEPVEVGSAGDVYRAFGSWLHEIAGGRAVFVSDNPAFDFQWIADGFARAAMVNPFGYSARRIGDFAAGLRRDWRKANDWKRYRRTRHDHNPVNDSLGNAEALATLLEMAAEG